MTNPRPNPRTRRAKRAPPAFAPPLDLRHPAFLMAALVAAACVILSVSFRLYDTDMWMHLAVGRAIWSLHQVPTHQLWTWPTYGAPDVNASWGFRVLIWPLWHGFGVWGLFAWRWVSTLAAFGLLWAATRRMGARGFTPLIVMVLGSLVYRQRSQIRPETMVAVLLAAELWILESWRAESRAWEESRATTPRDRRPWLIVIALLWANVHISYWLGFAVQGIYLVAGRGSDRAPCARWLARLGCRGGRAPIAIFVASALASLVNPWGWVALWQPFDYFLNWRHEDIFKAIGELEPIRWSYNIRNGLPVLLVGWIVLMIWRARRHGVDAVEPLIFLLFGAQAFPTQRFLGFFALAAVPFVSRDLDAWVRSHSFPRVGIPRGPWTRGLATALACVAVGVPEWSRVTSPLGVAIEGRIPPQRACDFIQRHDLHGRGFNQFAAGGYMVYRFWPDRSRLPFMDIHQAGTREDRYLYVHALRDSSAWRYLDDKYRFDYVVHFTLQNPVDRLIDFLDADRAHWALVSTDDAAALFVRRDGSAGALAREYEFARIPAGREGLSILADCERDTALRRECERELERAIRESPWNARVRTMLAPLELLEGRVDQALGLLDDAIRQNPLERRAHAYRAQIELGLGKPREALRDFQGEIRITGDDAFLARGMARTLARLGDRGGARHWYQRAIQHDPNDQVARDSLAAL